jgi:WD40 repeat protein
MSFSPDGKFLATAAGDTATLWDLVKMQVVRTFSGHSLWLRAVAFNPKGDRLVTAGQDKTARVWDPATGEALVVFKEHTREVADAAFSPDGTRVVTAGVDTGRVWEAATGKEIAQLKERPATCVSFSPDGRRVASTAHEDSRVAVWDAATGMVEQELQTPNAHLFGIAFSPDGKRIAACGQAMAGKADNDADPTVRLWDAKTGMEVGTPLHRATVHGVCFSPDGKRLATAGEDRRVRFWDVATGAEVVPQGHDGPVNGVAFSPDGKVLASAGGDGTVRLWDLATGKWQRTLTGHEKGVVSVAFHKGGKLLASGSNDGTVRLWDLASDTSRALPGRPGQAVHVVFSFDGGRLAAAAGELAKLWDADTGKLRLEVPVSASAWCIAFSPDGNTLAAGTGDGTVRRWDVAAGWEMPAVKGDRGGPIRCLAFHPTDPLLATGGPPGDSSLRLWGLDPPREVQRLEGHTGAVVSCLWRADGRLLISAAEGDGMVRLWDLAGKLPRSKAIALGATRISALALSPEGRYLATANEDGSIYVLRLAEPGTVFRLP